MSDQITSQGQSVGLNELNALMDADLFDEDGETVENNHGYHGLYSLTTKDGQFEFRADLQSKNPDSSDDDARAEQTLTVTVTRLENGDFVRSIGDYEYHGDEPGDHLVEEGVETLIEGLISEVKSQPSGPRPGK